MLLNAALSLLPALLFLLILIMLDSYKLVRFNGVLAAILLGAFVCIVAYFANTTLLEMLAFDFSTYSRYVAPVLEEALKSILPVYLILTNRVGFMVDAAIYGFAVGAGFAVFENIYYLNSLENATIALWIIRGFGTAVMHGGVTAIFSIYAKNLIDRHQSTNLRYFVPGFALAVLMHSAFNHFFLSPVISTAVVIVVLPLVVFTVYNQSERMLEDWMELNYENESRLIMAMRNGQFSDTHAGRYILSIRERFDKLVVLDMCCLIDLYLDLSVKAKGVLLMKQAGFEPDNTDEIKTRLREVEALEKNIGPTGRLTLLPFLRRSNRELWQLQHIAGRQAAKIRFGKGD